MDMNAIEGLGDPGAVAMTIDDIAHKFEIIDPHDAWLGPVAHEIEQIVAHWRANDVPDLITGVTVLNLFQRRCAAWEEVPKWCDSLETAALALTFETLRRITPPIDVPDPWNP